MSRREAGGRTADDADADADADVGADADADADDRMNAVRSSA
ncbi:hypothetical protein ACWDA9_29675 [Streptomyces sp. NPDC001193]